VKGTLSEGIHTSAYAGAVAVAHVLLVFKQPLASSTHALVFAWFGV
jgi:hypothetical protein